MTRIEKFKEKRRQMYASRYELRAMLTELQRLCLVASRKKIIEKANEIMEFVEKEGL